MFCNKCGHKMQDNVAFCPNCGNKVGKKTFAERRKNSINVNRNKVIFWGGAIVLFLSGLIYFGALHTPESDLQYGYRDGSAWVKDCKEDVTKVVIPSEVTKGWKTYSVTKIGDSAFASCKNLTNIEIPDSVTEIGDNAFGGCESLTGIEIPDSVTKIGSSAFTSCKNLTNIKILGNLELDNVILPSGCIVNSKQEVTLYGTWREEGDVISFTFREDGTIRVAGLSDVLGADLFTFTEIDNNTLQLKAESSNTIVNLISVNLDYQISGDVMIVEIAGHKYKLMRYI